MQLKSLVPFGMGRAATRLTKLHFWRYSRYWRYMERWKVYNPWPLLRAKSSRMSSGRCKFTVTEHPLIRNLEYSFSRPLHHNLELVCVRWLPPSPQTSVGRHHSSFIDLSTSVSCVTVSRPVCRCLCAQIGFIPWPMTVDLAALQLCYWFIFISRQRDFENT